MLYLGKEAAKLGEDGLYDMMRFYTMSIEDFLDEYFESPLLKAAYAGSGIIGSAHGRHVARHRLRAAAPCHG